MKNLKISSLSGYLTLRRRESLVKAIMRVGEYGISFMKYVLIKKFFIVPFFYNYHECNSLRLPGVIWDVEAHF